MQFKVPLFVCIKNHYLNIILNIVCSRIFFYNLKHFNTVLAFELVTLGSWEQSYKGLMHE